MNLINKLKEKFFKGKVFQNVSWILLQNIYNMLLSLIFTSIIARYYGTEGYGIINFSSSFVTLFSFIAIFGTNHIIINDLSEKKYAIGTILGSNLFIRLLLAILSLIVSQLVALIMYDKTTNIAILLFNINVIISCSDIITYYAQSKIQNKYISISKMISVTIFSLLKLFAVIFKFDITLYIVTYIIENIVYTILLIISYFKIKDNDSIDWHIDFKYLKKLLSKSKYYALSTLMVTIYLKIDQVMLGTFFSNKSAVGVYSAAVRISEIWTFVPLSIITSFKPVIIESKQKNKTAYYNNLQKLYDVVSSICFIFVIGIIIFGKLGIYILYGSNYLKAYIPLILLTFGIWIGVLGNIHFIWMTCENKEKYSLLYSFIGSMINVILNSILIPRYNITGAAIATLISQISSNICAFLLIKNARNISLMLIKSLNPLRTKGL